MTTSSSAPASLARRAGSSNQASSQMSRPMLMASSPSPAWNTQLQEDLVDALGLNEHLGKTLFMLSTGSRRKVALVGLLTSGATVTCLDQPFAALDATSANVIRDFLADVADHETRTWVVADYAADPRLAWRRQIALD